MCCRRLRPFMEFGRSGLIDERDGGGFVCPDLDEGDRGLKEVRACRHSVCRMVGIGGIQETPWSAVLRELEAGEGDTRT